MLLGYKLNTVKKLDDYRKTVELFNKNNIIKIGDVVHIALKELTKPIEVVEVTLDLMLYGLLDDDSNLKYEFQPTFIIGGEPIPGPGELYRTRVLCTTLSIIPEEIFILQSSGELDFGKSYTIMTEYN